MIRNILPSDMIAAGMDNCSATLPMIYVLAELPAQLQIKLAVSTFPLSKSELSMTRETARVQMPERERPIRKAQSQIIFPERNGTGMIDAAAMGIRNSSSLAAGIYRDIFSQAALPTKTPIHIRADTAELMNVVKECSCTRYVTIQLLIPDSPPEYRAMRIKRSQNSLHRRMTESSLFRGFCQKLY